MENTLLIISVISSIISLISICISLIIHNKYEKTMKKLGEGKDFSKMLSEYIMQVDKLNKRDDQIIQVCNNINNELSHCIKKIGLYKYNAFGNTKNELSFSIALLDRENNGIVLNSIYGQDNSNIYAKEIVKGKSRMKLSDEEFEAVQIAINK